MSSKAREDGDPFTLCISFPALAFYMRVLLLIHNRIGLCNGNADIPKRDCFVGGGGSYNMGQGRMYSYRKDRLKMFLADSFEHNSSIVMDLLLPDPV